uniref:Uncharacterized protein n=1 Tax=Morchella brunnea TaxID=1174671 RepID=A0A8K1MH96_9PEZI|nr:hypothetical protein LK370_mgp222 [Morchella brunnea]UBU98430.1 hypothetical protein [Morchella brunnea]
MLSWSIFNTPPPLFPSPPPPPPSDPSTYYVCGWPSPGERGGEGWREGHTLCAALVAPSKFQLHMYVVTKAALSRGQGRCSWKLNMLVGEENLGRGWGRGMLRWVILFLDRDLVPTTSLAGLLTKDYTRIRRGYASRKWASGGGGRLAHTGKLKKGR